MRISKSELVSALNYAHGLCKRKSPLAVTNGIMCVANGDRMDIAATDLNTVYQTSVGIADNLIEQKFCIDCDKLLNIVQQFPDDIIPIDVRDNFVLIKNDQCKFKFATYNWEDFPLIPEIDDNYFIIKGKILKRIIDVALPVKAVDNQAFAQGILLSYKNNKLACVSTDKRRLHYSSFDLSAEEGIPEFSIIVPKSNLSIIKNIINDADDISIAADSTFFSIKTDNYNVSVRLLEDGFPDLDKVLGITYDTFVKVSKDALINALKRMIIIADNVSLDVREDSISLSAFDPDAGESKELISAMGNAAVIINLSGKYLLDALSLVTCADVEIMVKDAKSAVVIKTDTDSFIIMPMKG